MATAIGYEDVIEAFVVGETTKEQSSTLMLWWTRLSRFVRRTIMRTKNRMNQILYSLPPVLQRSLVLFAVVVGWFTAWMLFIITLSIAFELGVGYGLGMVFLWCTVVAYFIDA